MWISKQNIFLFYHDNIHLTKIKLTLQLTANFTPPCPKLPQNQSSEKNSQTKSPALTAHFRFILNESKRKFFILHHEIYSTIFHQN